MINNDMGGAGAPCLGDQKPLRQFDVISKRLDRSIAKLRTEVNTYDNGLNSIWVGYPPEPKQSNGLEVCPESRCFTDDMFILLDQLEYLTSKMEDLNIKLSQITDF